MREELYEEARRLARWHLEMEGRSARERAPDYECFQKDYAQQKRRAGETDEFDSIYQECLADARRSLLSVEELENHRLLETVDLALSKTEPSSFAIAKALAISTTAREENVLVYFLDPPAACEPAAIAMLVRDPRYLSIPPATINELVHWCRFGREYPAVAPWLAEAPRAVHFFGHCFHPVGQGLFSSGYVSTKGGQFHWVYDCGSAGGSSLVAPAVRNLAKEVRSNHRNRPKLGLVAISHFDQDHVSGFLDLLRHFDIGILLLPFLTFAQRLEVALQQGASARGEFFRFLVSPGAFVDALGAGEVDHILLVPPAREGEPTPPFDGDPEDETAKEGALDPIYITDDAPDPDVGADPQLDHPRVEVLRPGTALTIAHAWEFLPYNDGRHAWRASNALASQVETIIGAMRDHSAAQDWQACENDLELLKGAYDIAFGDSAWMRNIISLFLYCGPIGHVEAACLMARNSHTPSLGRMEFCGGAKVGALLTGDGYLHTEQRLIDLVRFFGPYDRLGRSGVFQVMHHGSKRNWHVGVAAALAPLASLFCADGRHYGHPDRKVWNDFKPWNPVLVGKRNSWRVDGLFRRG